MVVSRARAFTLVELLIVVIIVSILAAIALPRVQRASTRATETAAREQLRVLRNAVNMFEQDTERYPLQISDLNRGVAPAEGYNSAGNLIPINAKKFRGPYLATPAVPPALTPWISYNGAKRGRVWCPQSGNDSKGVPYASW